MIVGTIVIVVMPSIVIVAAIMVMVVTILVIVLIAVFVVLLHQERHLRGQEDVSQRQLMRFGDLDAVFVLGSKDHRLVGTPRELALHRAEVGFDRVGHPLTNRPLDQLPPNPQRVRFVEEDCLQLGRVFGLADHAEDDAGAILLHLDGGRIDIECSGGQ